MRPDIFVLFTRPFWLDEWHLMLVANRPSVGAVISDLHSGSDFGPPFLHLFIWALQSIFGSMTPTVLRVVSFLAVAGALTLIYRTLRRHFDRSASATAIVCIAATKLVVGHAFEIRFYALWFFFAALFVFLLGLDDERRNSLRRDLGLALAAAFLCTTHWFGVISLGLMCAAAFATRLPDWKSGVRRVAPAAAGLVALVVALPLMIGQRSSIRETTWIPDLSWQQVGELAEAFWTAWAPLLAILILLVIALRPARRAALRSGVLVLVRNPAIAAMLALALMPLVLIAISTRQPAMLPRYSIASFLAWGPLIAFAAHQLRPAYRGVIIGAFSVVFLMALGRSVAENRLYAYRMQVGKTVMRESCKWNVPVIFQVRYLMYPIAADEWQSCPQVRYLELSNPTIDRLFPVGSSVFGYRRFYRIENEFAHLHSRLYDFPRVASQTQLDTTSRFILIGNEQSLPRGSKQMDTFASIVFPNHRITKLGQNHTLFERQ